MAEVLRRIAGVVLALIIAGLSLVVSAPASAKSLGQVHGYGHDAGPSGDASNYTTTERGPSSQVVSLGKHTAVDRPSHGALARPDGPPCRAGITYNDPTRLVQSVQVTGTTWEQARRPDVELWPLTREGVAAEAGPLSMVPGNASLRTLTETSGIKNGVEFKWINESGQTVRLRVHGPDSLAPAGSNAAGGPTYRIQVGGRYVGTNGQLYPRGVFNPNSPNYDPGAANDTHIPWPSGVPLPW